MAGARKGRKKGNRTRDAPSLPPRVARAQFPFFLPLSCTFHAGYEEGTDKIARVTKRRKILNDCSQSNNSLNSEKIIHVRCIYKVYLLGDNEVDINIRMNKISIGTPPDSPLDSHQTVLLCMLKYGVRFQIFRVARIGLVCFDPANVLAATEAPFL